MEHRPDQYRQHLPQPPPVHHQQGSDQSSQQYPYSYGQPSSSPQYQEQHYPQPQATSSQTRPTSSAQSSKSRSWSFHSDKKRTRSISRSDDHHLSHEEKEKRRLQSKADPTLAMSEAEPSMIAAMTESSIGSLRSVNHKDAFGNVIADPDRSNPTRYRWERPLDTIRSFEAAIDGGYHRRSMMRADTDSMVGQKRLSSYGLGGQPRTRPNSYYSSRPVSFRPESTQFSLAAPQTPHMTRGSVYDARGYQDDYVGAHGPGPSRQRASRMQTDPQYQSYGREQDVYRLSHKDRSYETVTSAEGSRNSEPLGYQTDPTSSDNSSIERHSPAKRPEPTNDYGIGFSQSQAYSQNLDPGVNGGSQPPRPPPHGYGQSNGRGPVPRKDVATVLRRELPQQQQQAQALAQPAADKRKSWFSKRFSKNQ